MDALRQDIRFAIRSFARRPAFAVSAILSLAIGIAASTAVFSLMNAALFKAVPGVTRPERLVQIAHDVGGDDADVTWEVFDRLRRESSVLEDLAVPVHSLRHRAGSLCCALTSPAPSASFVTALPLATTPRSGHLRPTIRRSSHPGR